MLLVGDPDLAGLSDDETSRVIARMEWPLNYTKFVDSLYRAQIYRDQFARSRERGSNVVYSFSVALLVRVEKCNRYAN